jgi:Restriction endonuclease fold toxin 5
MLEGICKSGMTGAEAVAARTFARVIGTAIRAAASPGDPGQAFASAFLDDVFKQIDPPTNSNSNPNAATPVTPTAFDDEGRLNLGIVDPNATPEQQAQQLAAQLQRQGIPAGQAALMAQQALGNVVNGVAQLPQPTAAPATAPTNPGTLANSTTPPATTREPIWIAADGREVLPSATAPPTGTPRPFEGDQPGFPDPSLLPAGAQVTALRDDAGRTYWRVIADGVDQTVVGTAPAAPANDTQPVTQLETVVVTGRRVPRFESTDAQGNTLVTQGSAAALTTLAGTTLVATQLGEGFALGEGATTAARVLAGLARLASMPAAVLMLLFTPTNASEQFVDLAPGERFRTRPGERYGELQVQSADGRWLSMPGQVRLDQVQGRSMLSDDERVRIGAPLTTPISPQQTPPLVTPIPTDSERMPPLPGLEIQEPTGPTITTTPIHVSSPEDFIIFKTEQERYDDAVNAWRADPSLRDPRQTLGASDGGPGEWVLSGQRAGGVGYQEQISGVPRGVEYEVGGTKFDHFDPSRNVLIDTKDWPNYVLPEKQFWIDDVVNTAERQLSAVDKAGTNATVEWQVSTKEAADAIRKTLERSGNTRTTVVVVPKKGP